MGKTIKTGPLFFSRKWKGCKKRRSQESGAPVKILHQQIGPFFKQNTSNLRCFYTKYKNRLYAVLYFPVPKAGRPKDRPHLPIPYFGLVLLAVKGIQWCVQQFWQVPLKISYLPNPVSRCGLPLHKSSGWISFEFPLLPHENLCNLFADTIQVSQNLKEIKQKE